MEDKVVLERHRNRSYVVNFDGKRYFWAGAKGNIPTKIKVPRAVFDYLTSVSRCFENGELIISKDTDEELKEELSEQIYNKEVVEANSLTKDDVIKILKGNLAQLKSALNKIDSFTTKQFVLDVAREIGLTNSNKQLFIKEWYGSDLPIEDLFDLKETEEK